MDKPTKDGAAGLLVLRHRRTSTSHYSSGPLNHLFYLLSEGSGAKTINGVSYNSPTCNGATVTGIGRDAAAKIWYRALSTKLTSSSNYAGARDGAIASAKELYGAGWAQCLGRRERLHRHRGPGRHRDLRRHRRRRPPAPTCCGTRASSPARRSGPAPPARSPTTPAARPAPASGSCGSAATARRTTENDRPVGRDPVHRDQRDAVVLAAHRHRRDRLSRPTTR